MKKNKLWGVASILAAGALFFGVTGCDTGNDEYVEENPTTAYSYESSSVYDGAVWDFSGWTAKAANTIGESTIGGATEAAISGAIDCSTKGTSTDTKLVATSFKGVAGTNPSLGSSYLQASKGSATLADVSKGYYLTLTLGTASDIYIKGTGAGAAAAQRYIAIADADDNLLVYKDNLGSGTGYDFQVQAAPAGDYKIYINGSGICKIDLSSAHTYAQPKGYSSDDDLILIDLDEAFTLTVTDSEKTANTPYDNVTKANYPAWVSVYTAETYKKVVTYNTVDYTVNYANDKTTISKITYVDGTSTKELKADSADTAALYAAILYLLDDDDSEDVTDFATLTEGSTKYTLYPKYTETKTIESLIDKVNLGLADKEGNIVTLDATWSSLDNTLVSVESGVVSGALLKSNGTATIRARIGMFYRDCNVTVTPCTKTLATMFSSANSPSTEVELGVDWSSDEEKTAAVEKLVKADVVGGFATISDEAFAFSDKAKGLDWTGKEAPKLIKASDATASGGYKTGAICWKNEQSTAWTENTAFATITFKAKPVGTSAKLTGITFKNPASNSNASHYAVSAKVGNGSETDLVKCVKGEVTISTDATITEETSITVTLYVIGKANALNSSASGKAKSFGFNEVVAKFTE